MESKLQEKLLLKIIEKNQGINIYQLRKLLIKDFNIKVSYSTIHKHITIMDAKKFIKTKSIPIKTVKRLYVNKKQS